MAETIPSRRRIPVRLVVALLLAALWSLPYVTAVYQGRFAYGTDTLAHDIPVNLYGWRRVALTGQVPLWSDHLRGGLPMVGSFAFMPYYPLNWPMGLAVWLADARDIAAMGGGAAVMSPPGTTAVRWYTALHTLQWPVHHLLAVGLTFLFLRRCGRSDGAALLGGIVFGFSPHLVTLTYPGHLAKVQAIAWMPGALWALTPRRDGTLHLPSAVALGGGCLAMPFLAGHPQIAAFQWALAGAWCVGWSLNGRMRSGECGMGSLGCAWWRPLVLLPAAMALGFALAAPQLLPGLEMLPHSNRAALPYEEVAKSSYPPEELWELIVPNHRGNSVPEHFGGHADYRGRWGERLVSDYLGLLPLGLGLVGLMLGTGRARWFWLALFAIALVQCLGGYLGPLHQWLVETIPGAGLFRSPATGMVFLPLALAPLAALGAEALLALGHRRIASTTSLLLAPFAVVWVGTGLFLTRSDTLSFMTDVYPYVGAAMAVIVFALVLSRLAKRDPKSESVLIVGAALLALLEFSSVRDVYLHAPQVDDALLPRLAADALPPGEPVLPRGRMIRGRELVLWPMLHGWSVPLGYHPIYLMRQEAATRALGFDSLEFAALSRALAIEEGNGRFSIVKEPYEGLAGTRGGAGATLYESTPAALSGALNFTASSDWAPAMA